MIDGMHDSSLSGASIIGPIGYKLEILCDDIFSCQGLKINATHSSAVSIHCSGIKSCENLVYFVSVNFNFRFCAFRFLSKRKYFVQSTLEIIPNDAALQVLQCIFFPF